ncbi:hypothetical protein QTO34_018491 [Cnephaeus nilssonii]|uniref:Uncharacterized protein n=1 Tax=Cnephaeus nilssonii TaxID=3371016 RepID=A0AA40HZY9_CNENI|nr:hypothetical protein QTO34_018491 [Eptesicus nilssonii]
MKDPAGGVCEEEEAGGGGGGGSREEDRSPRRGGGPGTHTCAYSRFGGEHHHALGYDPTFPSASPHTEPEGDLSVFPFLGSLLRESCGQPERTPPARTETDRLPWLSYHSADAVHSKGTVLGPRLSPLQELQEAGLGLEVLGIFNAVHRSNQE